MSLSARIVLISFGAILVACAPAEIDAALVDSEDDAINEGHLNRGWEVAVAVVLTFVICTVIGVSLFVKLRQRRRRRQGRAPIASSARSSADRPTPRQQSASPPIGDLKASRIASPLPAVTYDRRSSPT